jgi:hemoglobin/transferrin/lactoferrin receptor protein
VDIGLFNLTNKRYWRCADLRGVLAEDPLLDLYTAPGFNAALSFGYRI